MEKDCVPLEPALWVLSLLCCYAGSLIISVTLKAISMPFTTIHYTIYVYQECVIVSLEMVSKKAQIKFKKDLQQRSSKSSFPLKSPPVCSSSRLHLGSPNTGGWARIMLTTALMNQEWASEALVWGIWGVLLEGQSLLEWKVFRKTLFPGSKDNTFLVGRISWRFSNLGEVSRTATRALPGRLAGMFDVLASLDLQKLELLGLSTKLLHVLQEYLHSRKRAYQLMDANIWCFLSGIYSLRETSNIVLRSPKCPLHRAEICEESSVQHKNSVIRKNHSIPTKKMWIEP